MIDEEDERPFGPTVESMDALANYEDIAYREYRTLQDQKFITGYKSEATMKHIIRASGVYLTEYLPKDYDQYSYADLLTYISRHKINAIRNESDEQVWEWMCGLADEFRQVEKIARGEL